MAFRNFDDLRSFVDIAQFNSISDAAEKMNLTKGALSHRIKRLEETLGFMLFKRNVRGITLTPKGEDLLMQAKNSFAQIESQIFHLKEISDNALTIGMSTYFASRWLSPRLMEFMNTNPNIRLRIEPILDMSDKIEKDIQITIRWGNGQWRNVEVTKLFSCPAWPTGNKDAYEKVQREGLESAFAKFTLLRDSDKSSAWTNWYNKVGVQHGTRYDTLIIPDPNVRVQAVLDGQGVALNDDLISNEIEAGQLFRLSDCELSDYGYFLVYSEEVQNDPNVMAFIDWIKTQG
ncbi:LysR family transcriptional regulator [Curvivirga aplysinae]|uniref:LysR family transcriptional regulator n=1 Tax=Curvivirga aplysinae TaxID=2529852 RepID=UPI0012BCC0B5|nr:LysR family transcriptional regulator [Curvivirga aplysinae]MTI11017.1 LysR family transcriptional regulator [Curvivirga aplysinae]